MLSSAKPICSTIENTKGQHTAGDYKASHGSGYWAFLATTGVLTRILGLLPATEFSPSWCSNTVETNALIVPFRISFRVTIDGVLAHNMQACENTSSKLA